MDNKKKDIKKNIDLMTTKLYEYIYNTQEDEEQLEHRLYEVTASFLMATVDFEAEDLKEEILNKLVIVGQMVLDGANIVTNRLDSDFIEMHYVDKWRDK